MTNTRLLLLGATLLWGAAPAASAAPHKSKPAQAAPALTAPHAVASGPFRDVPPTHWAAQAVETLRQKGIVRGYPAATDRTPTARVRRDRAR